MKLKTLLFPACMLFAMSCKKITPSNTPLPGTYLTISTGSTWNYHETNSSGATPVNTDYTLTSTSKDSLINGRDYHVFSNSVGNNQYLNITGNDYYQFDSLPAALGANAFERLYLKDNAAVGVNWAQNLSVTLPGAPFPIPVTITYNIAEKGILRTVNATTYSDVIHVSTTISSSLIPSASLTTSIDSYYAKKYGLIENSTIINLNYLGFVQHINVVTKLVSATIL